MIVQPHYPLSNRKAIEDEIERLFGLLDADEPDCDLEEEDDGQGIEDADEEGVGDHGRGLLPTLPRYGLDQSLGPINAREADLRYEMTVRQDASRGLRFAGKGR